VLAAAGVALPASDAAAPGEPLATPV